jgi:hypothetical protein
MGNFQSVDMELVNDILISGQTNTIFYPLTDTQSFEIRNIFNLIRHKQDASYLSIRYCESVKQISTIGNYKGDIVAFRFQQSKKPFIFFEYKNPNFQKWTQIINRSFNKKKKDDYDEVPNQMFIKFYQFDSEFHFVKNIKIISGDNFFSL